MAFIYGLLRQKWNPPAHPSPSPIITGRTVLITGANTGLGFEAAVKFAELGASTLILGVRSAEKGAAAKADIESRTKSVNPGCRIEVWTLDMASYDSVKAFAQRAAQSLDRLDVAVLNAGVMMAKYQKSAYGWEETLQVNLLSTVLLAILLLPKLRAARRAGGTPVLSFVNSGLYTGAQLTEQQQDPQYEGSLLEDFNKPNGFAAQVQYATSKLFLMYAAAAINQLGASSSTLKEGKSQGGQSTPDVYITSVGPGACKSDLGRNFEGATMAVVKYLFGLMQRTTEEGGRALVTGVTKAEQINGGFWQHDEVKEPAPLLQGAVGERLQKKVWREIVDALKRDVSELPEYVQL